MPRVLSSFELQADRAALAALAGEFTGFAVEDGGGHTAAVWLQGRDGRIWSVGAAGLDLEDRFEVFALEVLSLEALQARYAARGPQVPTPPDRFHPWSSGRWRCDVLRRAEFSLEDTEVSETFGAGPTVVQRAARPGAVPPEAIAACEVAVGLLFTSADGGRWLAAVDDMPYDIIWTQDAALINAYAATCKVAALDVYVRRIGTAG